MGYEARYVFRPTPGADMALVMQAMRQGVSLWKKHGAPEPRLQVVAAGELGQYVLVVAFPSAAEYARVTDAMADDPDFRRWQADNVRAGAFTWVRSNILRDVPLG